MKKSLIMVQAVASIAAVAAGPPNVASTSECTAASGKATTFRKGTAGVDMAVMNHNQAGAGG